jgi:hypothetical protein
LKESRSETLSILQGFGNQDGIYLVIGEEFAMLPLEIPVGEVKIFLFDRLAFKVREGGWGMITRTTSVDVPDEFFA